MAFNFNYTICLNIFYITHIYKINKLKVVIDIFIKLINKYKFIGCKLAIGIMSSLIDFFSLLYFLIHITSEKLFRLKCCTTYKVLIAIATI